MIENIARRTKQSSPVVQLPSELPGDYLKCFSCGRCVGDCPAAKHSSFNIRLIIHKMISDYEELLKDDIIWKCFQCDLCSLVCPVKLNPSSLIRKLRRDALIRGYKRERVETFVGFYKNFRLNGLIMPLSEDVKYARKKTGLKTPQPFINTELNGFHLIMKLPPPFYDSDTSFSSGLNITKQKKRQRSKRGKTS
ncbi:MAG: 4Fe-4S dicluster domain-containing protein [Candidatus Ranarchaeia archaeon]